MSVDSMEKHSITVTDVMGRGREISGALMI